MIHRRVRSRLARLADRAIRFAVRSAERERAALARAAKPKQKPAPRPAPERAVEPRSAPESAPATRTRRKNPDHREPSVDPSATSWTRDDVFHGKWSDRPLAEFVDSAGPVDWAMGDPSPMDSPDATLEWILAQPKWRYHHSIDGIENAPGFYHAYSRRVESMLQMVMSALATLDTDFGSTSFVDLGAAEGYTANRIYDAGARDVDCCDLNAGNLARMWKVRSATGRQFGRIGTIDLDRCDWARSLGRTYDVALALGIIYHMENPQLFCRNLRAVAPIALVESDTPVFPENDRFRGHGSLHLHRDQVTVDGGNIRYLTEMRPDRHALVELLLQAGYDKVSLVAPPPDGESHYFDTGQKTLLLATVDVVR